MALRPRLTTGLPLSQRAPLPLKEMHLHMYRLTQLWVGGQVHSATYKRCSRKLD